MSLVKTVLAIVGSAGTNSSNLQLVNYIASITKELFHLTVYDALQQLPHFNPAQSIENTPQAILDLRNKIDSANAVLICTPEYIFSIPSGLKNVFEWCVSTTVFAHKPVALITASAHGVKGHEELKLILKTVDAFFADKTTLLIQGIKGKMDSDGQLADEKTKAELQGLVEALNELITTTNS
jgi:NAD(P)H-dependent FMN reductase